MKDTIYLNNSASCYPRPEAVDAVIINSINTPPYHPGRAGLQESTCNFVDSCRQRLARLFNVLDPSNIILNSGATESLNTAIVGLAGHGSHIITTAAEHNSSLRPLYRLARERQIELTILDCDSNGHVVPEQFQRAVRDNTSLFVVNHCSNVTGAVQDIRAIANVAHLNDALIIVDASQSAGLYSIDVIQDDIDVLVFAGHKYLYGLPGTGGFYLNPNIRLRPLKVGGTGVRSDLTEQPPHRPMLYEAGTPNMTGLAALNAGVEFVLDKGVEVIRKRVCSHIERLFQEVSNMPESIIYAKGLGGNSSMLTFNIEGISPEETAYMLENSFGITTRSGLHCAPLIHSWIGCPSEGCVRISPSVFTTDEQITTLCQAIRQIAGMKVCL